jgi:hypothetical protein
VLNIGFADDWHAHAVYNIGGNWFRAQVCDIYHTWCHYLAEVDMYQSDQFGTTGAGGESSAISTSIGTVFTAENRHAPFGFAGGWQPYCWNSKLTEGWPSYYEDVTNCSASYGWQAYFWWDYP